MLIDHFAPPRSHPLHPFVLCIFRLRARGAFRTETILPKGNVDILFNLGPPERVSALRGTFECATTLVTGLHTRAIVVTPGRNVHIVGVSLRPETCSALLHAPAGDFTDTFIDGSLVLSDADRLLNRLAESATFAEQRDVLLAWLLRRVQPDDNTALVAYASRLLRGTLGAGAVGLAARRIGMSRRHL